MSRRKDKANKSLAERRQDFFKHFRTYLAMSIFFVVLNVLTPTGHFWAIYPILGWGLGVLMEYWSLFGPMKDTDEALDLEDPLDLDDFNRPQRQQTAPQVPGKGYREEDLI